jgi:hypothetical protein
MWIFAINCIVMPRYHNEKRAFVSPLLSTLRYVPRYVNPEGRKAGRPEVRETQNASRWEKGVKVVVRKDRSVDEMVEK